MDQTCSLREEFAKWSGDFEYLCGLFCRVLEESEAGDVAAFIRRCFGGSSAEQPDRDVVGGPIQLCQALSIAFQLLTIVEENTANQMRRRAKTLQRQSEPGLWLYNLADLAARGFTEDQVRATLETVACEAVLTAHPTEAKPRPCLSTTGRSTSCCLSGRAGTEIEFDIFEERMKAAIERLWRTGEIFLSRPDVTSEIRNVLHYFEKSSPTWWSCSTCASRNPGRLVFHPTHRIPTRLSGFSNETRQVDQDLQKIASGLGVKYVSVTNVLCNNLGCLARLGLSADDLVQVDTNHLSNAGSDYVVSRLAPQIFKPIEEREMSILSRPP